MTQNREDNPVFYCQNLSGEKIPANSALEVFDSVMSGNLRVFKVRKPSADDLIQIFISPNHEIPIGETFKAHRPADSWVKYEGRTIASGQSIGTSADEWYMEKDKLGYISMAEVEGLCNCVFFSSGNGLGRDYYDLNEEDLVFTQDDAMTHHQVGTDYQHWSMEKEWVEFEEPLPLPEHLYPGHHSDVLFVGHLGSIQKGLYGTIELRTEDPTTGDTKFSTNLKLETSIEFKMDDGTYSTLPYFHRNPPVSLITDYGLLDLTYILTTGEPSVPYTIYPYLKSSFSVNDVYQHTYFGDLLRGAKVTHYRFVTKIYERYMYWSPLDTFNPNTFLFNITIKGGLKMCYSGRW